MKLIFWTGLLSLMMAVSAQADMRGQVVCGVDPDEAAVITILNSEGAWNAWTPKGVVDFAPSRTEREALSNWADSVSLVCEVKVRIGLRVLSGRFYRMGRKLVKSETTADSVTAGEVDVRRLIIGVAAPQLDFTEHLCGQSLENRSHCLYKVRNIPECHVWLFRPRLPAERIVTWTGRCVEGLAQGDGRIDQTWNGGGEIAEGRMEKGVRVGLWREQLKAAPEQGMRQKEYGQDTDRVKWPWRR